MVDNSLSPHGGTLIERIAPSRELGKEIHRLPRVELRDQLAREIVNIAYGFFSPLQGFMGWEDLDSVARHMTLANGYVWSIPIVFDISQDEISELGIDTGDSLLLVYQGEPLATLEVQEMFAYDKEFLAQQIYGTTDSAHPGVMRTYAYEDRFLAGTVMLVNTPVINPPSIGFGRPLGNSVRRLASWAGTGWWLTRAAMCPTQDTSG